MYVFITEKRRKEEYEKKKSKIYIFPSFPSEQPVILHDLRGELHSICFPPSAF